MNQLTLIRPRMGNLFSFKSLFVITHIDQHSCDCTVFSYFYLTPGCNLCITTETINWTIKKADTFNNPCSSHHSRPKSNSDVLLNISTEFQFFLLCWPCFIRIQCSSVYLENTYVVFCKFFLAVMSALVWSEVQVTVFTEQREKSI